MVSDLASLPLKLVLPTASERISPAKQLKYYVFVVVFFTSGRANFVPAGLHRLLQRQCTDMSRVHAHHVYDQGCRHLLRCGSYEESSSLQNVFSQSTSKPRHRAIDSSRIKAPGQPHRVVTVEVREHIMLHLRTSADHTRRAGPVVPRIVSSHLQSLVIESIRR